MSHSEMKTPFLRRRSFLGRFAAAVAGLVAAGGVHAEGAHPREEHPAQSSGITPRIHPLAVPRTIKGVSRHG